MKHSFIAILFCFCLVRFAQAQVSNLISVHADSLKTFPAKIPENKKSYPENRMFGLKLPGSGFYLRHVKEAAFSDVTIEYMTPDPRPVFYLDDVTGVQFNSVLIDNKRFTKNRSMLSETRSEITAIKD